MKHYHYVIIFNGAYNIIGLMKSEALADFR